MSVVNQMQVEFSAVAENEAFARLAASAFCLMCDPTVSELEDVKTAVSEAVTNAVIHGYAEAGGIVSMQIRIDAEDRATIIVRDFGIGIADIEQAREPFYTSRPDMERSGMGFTVMEAFMDSVKIQSTPGQGTTLTMVKKFKGSKEGPVAQ